jgi:hypothetical protein
MDAFRGVWSDVDGSEARAAGAKLLLKGRLLTNVKAL